MFKVVKEYPDSRLFTHAVDGILGLAHKIDAKMLTAIVGAMQEGHETMKELTREIAEKDQAKNKSFMNHPGFIALMKKRLSTVFSSVEISSKASFLEEMEEKVSLTCLYQLVQDMVNYRFPLAHFEPLRRIKFLTLLEKLFLNQKNLSVDCLAAYVKLLLQLSASECIPEEDFLDAVSMFVYLSLHVPVCNAALSETPVLARRRQRRHGPQHVQVRRRRPIRGQRHQVHHHRRDRRRRQEVPQRAVQEALRKAPDAPAANPRDEHADGRAAVRREAGPRPGRGRRVEDQQAEGANRARRRRRAFRKPQAEEQGPREPRSVDGRARREERRRARRGRQAPAGQAGTQLQAARLRRAGLPSRPRKRAGLRQTARRGQA